MFGRMSPELRDLIVAATAAITDTSAGGLRERARGALYLAAISSEYSVYSDTSVAGAGAVQPPTGLAVSGLGGLDRHSELARAAHRARADRLRARRRRAPGRSAGDHSDRRAPTPSFTFQAPPGAFYIRLRTVSGAAISRPSGEIRLYVGRLLGSDGAAVADRLRQRTRRWC